MRQLTVRLSARANPAHRLRHAVVRLQSGDSWCKPPPLPVCSAVAKVDAERRQSVSPRRCLRCIRVRLSSSLPRLAFRSCGSCDCGFDCWEPGGGTGPWASGRPGDRLHGFGALAGVPSNNTRSPKPHGTRHSVRCSGGRGRSHGRHLSAIGPRARRSCVEADRMTQVRRPSALAF